MAVLLGAAVPGVSERNELSRSTFSRLPSSSSARSSSSLKSLAAAHPLRHGWPRFRRAYPPHVASRLPSLRPEQHWHAAATASTLYVGECLDRSERRTLDAAAGGSALGDELLANA